jgi:hypothetical protein
MALGGGLPKGRIVEIYGPESSGKTTLDAACQRYYYRIFPGGASKTLGLGESGSATSYGVAGFFPVEMRVAPTALEQSGTANQYQVRSAGVSTTCSAVPAYSPATSQYIFHVTFTVASGLTAGQGGRGITDATNGANAYLGWSAEL